MTETTGLSSFEFRELEGVLEPCGGDIKLIFSGDFWFAFQPDWIFASGFETPLN